MQPIRDGFGRDFTPSLLVGWVGQKWHVHFGQQQLQLIERIGQHFVDGDFVRHVVTGETDAVLFDKVDGFGIALGQRFWGSQTGTERFTDNAKAASVIHFYKFLDCRLGFLVVEIFVKLFGFD